MASLQWSGMWKGMFWDKETKEESLLKTCTISVGHPQGLCYRWTQATQSEKSSIKEKCGTSCSKNEK